MLAKRASGSIDKRDVYRNIIKVRLLIKMVAALFALSTFCSKEYVKVLGSTIALPQTQIMDNIKLFEEKKVRSLRCRKRNLVFLCD